MKKLLFRLPLCIILIYLLGCSSPHFIQVSSKDVMVMGDSLSFSEKKFFIPEELRSTITEIMKGDSLLLYVTENQIIGARSK